MSAPAREEAAESLVWGPLSRIGLAAAVLAFVADQASKVWLLQAYDMEARGFVELTPFLNLIMVWNKGISYGLLEQESDLGRWLLVALKLAASVALWAWLAQARSRLMAISIGLVVGGALGNALDRVLYGAVADFFSLHAFGFYWYVFNVADVAIVAGVVGLLVDALKPGRNAATQARFPDPGQSGGAG